MKIELEPQIKDNDEVVGLGIDVELPVFSSLFWTEHSSVPFFFSGIGAHRENEVAMLSPLSDRL